MPIQILPPYDIAEYDRELQRIIAHVAVHAKFTDKIYQISQLFLACPYVRGALGEGPAALFDQNPLYRHDVFDCVTYVNTVLALAGAKSLESFKKKLLQLSYYEEDPRYQKRLHFISADWNPLMQQLDVLHDATPEIIDKNNRSLAVQAEAVIDRPNWIRFHRLERIKLLHPLSPLQAQQRLTELHALADHLEKEKIKIFYLPLHHLFEGNGRPNYHLFNQILHASIIEIVRPNWDLRKKIGTRLHISHMGFGFWINNQLIFRHASESAGVVSDNCLIEYLKKYLDSPTVKGIKIIRINQNSM